MARASCYDKVKDKKKDRPLQTTIGKKVLVCANGVAVFVLICISRNVFFDVGGISSPSWNRRLNGIFLVIILLLGNNPVAKVYLDGTDHLTWNPKGTAL